MWTVVTPVLRLKIGDLEIRIGVGPHANIHRHKALVNIYSILADMRTKLPTSRALYLVGGETVKLK